MAPAVGAAGPPPGRASVGRGGAGVAACRKHGEGGGLDPTANSESSARRWSRMKGARMVGH